MDANVLIIGNGGREHALTWKLASSDKVRKIFVSRGNAGTGQESKAQNIELNLSDTNEVAKWCLDNQISLVVVGPEAPLAEGMYGLTVKFFVYFSGVIATRQYIFVYFPEIWIYFKAFAL